MTMTTASAPHIALHFDDWGQLVLIDEQGQSHAGVMPLRLFPLSDPEHWISICDSASRELVCIVDPAQLPAPTRDMLTLALSKTEFAPVIQRIVHATHGEPAEWQVQTDRGDRTFVLKGDDDIRSLNDGRMMVTDSDGVRYIINDARHLDGHSRRALERFL